MRWLQLLLGVVKVAEGGVAFVVTGGVIRCSGTSWGLGGADWVLGRSCDTRSRLPRMVVESPSFRIFQLC